MTPIQQALSKYWDALRLQVFLRSHLRRIRADLQKIAATSTSLPQQVQLLIPVDYSTTTLLTTSAGTKAYTSALTNVLTTYGHSRFDLKLGKAKALFGEEPADEKANWWIELTIGQPTSTRL